MAKLRYIQAFTTNECVKDRHSLHSCLFTLQLLGTLYFCSKDTNVWVDNDEL